jgi:hypothetical protein
MISVSGIVFLTGASSTIGLILMESSPSAIFGPSGNPVIGSVSSQDPTFELTDPHLDATVDDANETLRPWSTTGSLVGSAGRVIGASFLALGLTGVFLIPSLLTHIGLGLLAPISSGYMTGRMRRLSGGEACAVAILLGLCIGLPVPVAQREFGVLAQLSPLAVIFFSSVVAVYYGALIGIMGWYGGHLARRESCDVDDFIE